MGTVLKIKNRWYQDEAIEAAMSSDNGVIVSCTGSGKSLISSGIVQRCAPEKTLILQPTAEILKSNIKKVHWAGLNQATAYSASYGEKEMSDVVFATIGSIINQLENFIDYKNVIIDECHLVNSDDGMYKKLIEYIKPSKLIGLTATPYRQHARKDSSETCIITRTTPSIFKDIIYQVNTRRLIDEGYILDPEVHEITMDDSVLVLNSTGGDYTEESITVFISENDIIGKVREVVRDVEKSFNHILIFADSIATSQEMVSEISSLGISATEINSNTKNKEAKLLLSKFERGEIKVLLNVGKYTTGFDFPALDCTIDARPIRSVSLHYQKFGRVVRPFEGKNCSYIDMAGNVARLGNPLKYDIREGEHGPELWSDRGRISPSRKKQSAKSKAPKPFFRETDNMPFGMHKGTQIKDVPIQYIKYIIDQGKIKGPLEIQLKSQIKKRWKQKDLMSNKTYNKNSDYL